MMIINIGITGKKLVLINMGIGNIYSVLNTSIRLKFDPHIVEDGNSLLKYSSTQIVLSLVGAVGEALKSLEEKNFYKCFKYSDNK